MKRVELSRGERLDAGVLSATGGVDEEVLGVAARVLEDVRERGDDALREYTSRFDGVDIDDPRVDERESESAMDEADPVFLDAIEQAAWAIEDFHRRQEPRSWFHTSEGGPFVGQMVRPLARVGIYVPGGRATYPSSVLMNAIPASVAGVEEIAMVVPPAKDGSVPAETLVAAVVAGVTEIYKVGGAQAIGALAYGTDTIRRVDKITGPGNAYVTAAKKLVMGEVGIDMLAGPSEALILADGSAPPEFVAADMMVQAEHDPRAAVYLVTTDAGLADSVEALLEEMLGEAPRADIIREAFAAHGLVVVVPDVETALDTVNAIAPEHLSVMMVDAMDLLGSIRNAGAIFLGPWTPESAGDYVAGPNHVLPTGGTARFSSPLSVEDFVKRSSVLQYSRDALALDAPAIEAIARAEGLDAHARAVRVRLAGHEAFDPRLEGGEE